MTTFVFYNVVLNSNEIKFVIGNVTVHVLNAFKQYWKKPMPNYSQSIRLPIRNSKTIAFDQDFLGVQIHFAVSCLNEC